MSYNYILIFLFSFLFLVNFSSCGSIKRANQSQQDQDGETNAQRNSKDNATIYDENNLPIPKITKINAKINKMGMLDVWTKIYSDRKLHGSADQMLEILAKCNGKSDSMFKGLVMIEREREFKQRLFMQTPLPSKNALCNLKISFGKIGHDAVSVNNIGNNRKIRKESLNNKREMQLIGEYCFKGGKECTDEL
ncbi:MAG: hypothetical protein HQK51_02555 [Oligoflexia bacterium]|nr:hypothetical protein [Oligoflexia bacterium]